ncbi:YeiH family protein [Allorhodopirellula heiligendammensis]|uniref:Sulfate exporter family transporter n=1 Tax=Allorhodopirellula heiligendammensis TaxID=2714739 RepID=A0A5C6BZ15_9BACT|nr:putative sulfate exporter family transporter [Allorhodopirellula heiligendammensis]TWU16154.1 hypothetical protein Poly21_33590 [Allorhodopirellula heiligendammensis]
MSESSPTQNPDDPPPEPAAPVSFWSEDLLAIVIGWSILLVSLACVRFVTTNPDAVAREAVGASQVVEPETEATHLLAPYVGKPSRWYDDPVDAFRKEIKPEKADVEEASEEPPPLPPAPTFQPELSRLTGTLGAGLILGGLFTLVLFVTGGRAREFLLGFPAIFLLAVLSYVMAGQAFVSAYNLEYALWALVVGLVISNTVGTPEWMRGAVRTEFFIKTGLVLLGSEILMSRLLALGLPGVFVAWVVTPIVLISTFWFGQKVLKLKSPTLNMVISADMSVCGVSAAIASAAACRAKKEELSLAIGMSLSFTVIMMVVMPAVIRFTGMDEVLGGAWMGGTIDSTGAVAAAGEFLGDRALEVAATIKMIQNILIGVVAFGIAVFWTTYMDRDPNSKTTVGWSEIWLRFPKFILGFIIASIVFSLIAGFADDGAMWTGASIGFTKGLRGWLFCLAFVSIGLETNYAAIKENLSGGKPLLLYVCGQSLNLVLTLAMAYLMFKVVFPTAGQ